MKTEIEDLRRQLRTARRRASTAFQTGFDAAARMAEAGATPERLREASDQGIAYDDTQPIEIIEEITEVDIIPAGVLH